MPYPEPTISAPSESELLYIGAPRSDSHMVRHPGTSADCDICQTTDGCRCDSAIALRSDADE